MTRLWKRRGLDECRRLTEWFIDDSPSTIRLVPHKQQDRPGGTHEWIPQKARKPQQFRLIPTGGWNTNDGKVAVEGADISKWRFHLIGKTDCEFEIGDTWTWGGLQYRIISLLPQNNWERRALVTVFGQAPPENTPVDEPRDRRPHSRIGIRS